MDRPLISDLAQQLADRLTITELADGSGVLLDLQGHQVLSLNGSALLLAQTLARQGNDASLDSLATAMADAFDVTVAQARTDAGEFVATLSDILAP